MKIFILLLSLCFLISCSMTYSKGTGSTKRTYGIEFMQMQTEKGNIAAKNSTIIGLKIRMSEDNPIPEVSLGYVSDKQTLVPVIKIRTDQKAIVPSVLIETEIDPKGKLVSDRIKTESAVEYE